jgi:hypothetical protein
MQHALVYFIHELGRTSPHGDGSVRMRDLFNRIEHEPIESADGVDRGPHRFSLFNSGLTGRRSASALFEQIDDSERRGAWWRLRVPFAEALEIAQKQSNDRRRHTRTKQTEPGPDPAPKIKAGALLGWNRTLVFESLEEIKEFAVRTRNLELENRELEMKSVQLADEIGQLRENAPPAVLEMLEVYRSGREQVEVLKRQLVEVEERLGRATNGGNN